MKLEVRFLKQKKDEKKEVEKSVPETASQETRIEDTSKTVAQTRQTFGRK